MALEAAGKDLTQSSSRDGSGDGQADVPARYQRGVTDRRQGSTASVPRQGRGRPLEVVGENLLY